MTREPYLTTSIELIDSVGAWPEHALDDINNARIKLMEKGHSEITNIPPLVCAPPMIWHGLDCMFHKTHVTYKQFFKNNNLSTFIKDKEMEAETVIVFFENDSIQINEIKLDFDKTCSFCPSVFHIHQEATQLHDGRLVCDECYAKVFDSIL